MAELVVGLSKSVVVGAITKVQAAIEEDANLQRRMRRNFVFITLELEMMQSFLDDANQEMKNNLVRTWVKHIRQLAYEIEDFVEIVVDLNLKPMFWRRLFPFCIGGELLLDAAVEELEQLKGRVEDVNNCYRRYNLINDSAQASRPAVVIQQQPPEPGASSMLSEARDATKRQHGIFGDLTELINKKDTNLQVISLWGSAGDHGTTSIIRATFTHSEICQDFTNRAWVKLMHPFSPQGFIRSLMAQFYANSCEEENAATGGMHVLTKMKATQAHLFNEFKQLILETRYLVVLEGLSTMVDWDAIRTFLPDTKNGSCIILSTQHPEIASLCLGHFYDILELEKLSDDHSVCALFKETRVDEASQSSLSRKETRKAEDRIVHQRLIARESKIFELRSCLATASNKCSHVMSVWGMAGVGKSSLVRSLYFGVMHDGKQFEKYSWVDVSHPFNLRSLYRSLLSDIYSQKDPVKYPCRQLLEQHRCLVVINGIRSKEEWDLIQPALVPRTRASRSVIIVITPEESIAAYCTDNKDLMLNVQCLEDLAAFELFKNEVHKKDPSSPLIDHDSEDVNELILKCGGIPRVIAGIAELLASRTDNMKEAARSLNERFMHHLEIDPEFHSLQGVFRWMHSIILNPPDLLKPCIFYLSIFTPDCHIRRRRLLRRWIAEGYSKESVEIQAEKNADNFFSELIQLSIFKKLGTTASKGVGLYQVNGFIYEYVASQRMEETLVFEKKDTPTNRGRHVIIRETWYRDLTLFLSMDFSGVRSLTVSGWFCSYFISPSMWRLRVLDLEGATDVEDYDLEKMVKCVPHLKFLSLRGCQEIRNLPSSLGDLRQLQTLDVRYTYIVTMPASIAKLKRLQYFRAGTTDVLAPTPYTPSSWFCRRRPLVDVVVPGVVVAPFSFWRMKELHTLGVVNVAASGGSAFLRHLSQFSQLRKLGVSGINWENSRYFVHAISGLHHLESLSVQIDKDKEDCLDDIPLCWERKELQFCWEDLRSLKLYGLGDKLPLPEAREDLQKNAKFQKLDLEMNSLNRNDVAFLGKLPKLSILRLRLKQLQDGKLHFYAGSPESEEKSYEEVQILEIACPSSSSQLNVTFGSESMQKLELLEIDCSNGSSYEFSAMENLPQLKQVLLKGSNGETMKARLESLLANHPKRPLVNLVVKEP